MSLERLDRWFDTLVPAARVEGVSMLDGYLTAIIVGPRSVPPEEWFDDVGVHVGISPPHRARC